ncbi:MAG: hypothetical protein ACK521_09270 [bacterium]
MPALDDGILTSIQNLFDSLNPETGFGSISMNSFQENIVSTFFNRLDAILTSIIISSEKNSFFKPGQTYLDMALKEFSLNTIISF